MHNFSHFPLLFFFLCIQRMFFINVLKWKKCSKKKLYVSLKSKRKSCGKLYVIRKKEVVILIVEKQFKILRKNDLRLLIKIMHEANTKSISYVCCGNQRCGENMCIKFFPLLKNHLKKACFNLIIKSITLKSIVL